MSFKLTLGSREMLGFFKQNNITRCILQRYIQWTCVSLEWGKGEQGEHTDFIINEVRCEVVRSVNRGGSVRMESWDQVLETNMEEFTGMSDLHQRGTLAYWSLEPNPLGSNVILPLNLV